MYCICIKEGDCLRPLMVDGGIIKEAPSDENISLFDEAKAKHVVSKFIPQGQVLQFHDFLSYRDIQADIG